MAPRSTSFSTDLTFGVLLKQLRKRAGMTQGDLAAALGYSIALISSLEKAQRRPDLQAVTERFIPALGLQDDPHLAASLIEQAALARGERPPAAMTFQRTTQMTWQEERAVTTTHLPAPPTLLIGRTAETTQLCNRLLGHSGRLLTLVGPPGVGKTTLALAVATQMQPHYRDGAYFVLLAAVSDPLVMATTIIGVVAPADTSAKPPESRLIELLRHRALLLVLDNLEQIGGAAPLIATILAECPAVTILATSRERLHLRAEQRFKVPPLELPAAMKLFVQRAQAVDAAFEPVPEQEVIIAAICQRLDCLPLALELCAAQIDLLSPVQLLAQLQDNRLDLLVAGSHDLPPHQRTLRTAIEYSYRLLSEDERILFCRLGVFLGGFDLAAVAAVTGEERENGTQRLLATLHALIGKSLVRSETLPSGEQRFLLLETIREFALEQVRIHGEEEQLKDLHARYFLALAERSAHQLEVGYKKAEMEQLEGEIDNLRAAFHYLLLYDTTDALRLAMALREFWYARDYYTEGRAWLAQAVVATATATTTEMLTMRGWAMLLAAQLASHQGDKRQAEVLLESGIALFRQTEDRIGLAEALLEAGRILQQDRPTEAIDRLKAACRIYQEQDNRQAIAWTMINLGTAYGHLQQWAAAEQMLERALSIFHELDSHIEKPGILSNLGLLYQLQGQEEKAEHMFRTSISLCREQKNHNGEIWVRNNLGNHYRQQGRWAEANEVLEVALHLAREQGDLNEEAKTLERLASIDADQNDMQQAIMRYEDTLRLYRILGKRHDEGRILYQLAELMNQQTYWERAVALFDASLYIFREIGSRSDEENVLNALNKLLADKRRIL